MGGLPLLVGRVKTIINSGLGIEYLVANSLAKGLSNYRHVQVWPYWGLASLLSTIKMHLGWQAHWCSGSSL